MKIFLANPRGFCAGVDRAIEIVERALETFGPPVYVRHEVVHNRFVVNGLAQQGARFVERVDEVPDNSILIFSAHGVPQSVRLEAKERGLSVFDATCPLVTKVHMEVKRYLKEGRECVLIGHAGHPEVEGTLGQYDPDLHPEAAIHLVESVADVDCLEVRDPRRLAFVTQTTLSVDDTAVVIDALVRRFPSISGPKKEDICYATQNRQDAVKKLAADCDVFVVVGSPESSNSNRLREVAQKLNIPAHLIDNSSELRRDWFVDGATVGVTAGASAPEVLVQGVVDRLREWGGTPAIEVDGVREKITFGLPKDLAQAQNTSS